MPGNVLEIAYLRMNTWALPLRSAIQANPALTAQDGRWRDGPLSDLAFAIATRLGRLPEIIRSIDESLGVLGLEFAGKEDHIDGLVRECVGYTFRDYHRVRDLLIRVASFIAESRACFEHLSRFYGEFLRTYFRENPGDKAACYAAVAAMAPSAQCATDLQQIRHDVLHERALWVAFEVRPNQAPRYEVLFLLNWRPGTFEARDSIPMRMLRNIREGLDAAARGLQGRLIERVQRWR